MVKTLVPSPLSYSQLARAPKLPPRISRPRDAKRRRRGYHKGRKVSVLNAKEAPGERDNVKETKTIIAGKAAFPSLVSPMEFVRLQNQVEKRAYVNPACPANSSALDTDDNSGGDLAYNKSKRKTERNKRKKNAKKAPLSPPPPSPPAQEKPKVVRSTAELIQREQDRNIWKLGRLKKNLILVFKKLTEESEKLDKARKSLGTGWNPEPLTAHQKATILKYEKQLSGVRSKVHGALDKLETIKVQVNNLRKDKMHVDAIFQRHLKDLRNMKNKTTAMREEKVGMDIDRLREKIMEINKTDSMEEARFREEISQVRASLRKHKLRANKKSMIKSKRNYEPTNAEVHEKGHFSKYIAEAALYDAMTEKDKDAMKAKLSHQDWLIQKQLQEKKRHDERAVQLNIAWQAIKQNEPTIVSMEEFVLAYLEYKAREYTQVSRSNALTTTLNNITNRNNKTQKEITDYQKELENHTRKNQDKNILLNKILGAISAEQQVAQEKEKKYKKLIENAVPSIQRLLACGLFDGEGDIKDQMILSTIVNYENVLEVLGHIESRIYNFDIGRKNNLHISDKKNVFVDPKIPSPLKGLLPRAKRRGLRKILQTSKLPSSVDDSIENAFTDPNVSKYINKENGLISASKLREKIMSTEGSEKV